MDKTFMENRFKKLCDRLGYKIVPLTAFINGRLTKRADIQAVTYQGDLIMVVPKRMYGFIIDDYTDFGGNKLPDYFNCEATLIVKTMNNGEF